MLQLIYVNWVCRLLYLYMCLCVAFIYPKKIFSNSIYNTATFYYLSTLL